MPKTDDALKPDVIKWAAFYEHRCKMGSKVIFHLEAFVAKYMRLYERYVAIPMRCLANTQQMLTRFSFLMGIDFD